MTEKIVKGCCDGLELEWVSEAGSKAETALSSRYAESLFLQDLSSPGRVAPRVLRSFFAQRARVEVDLSGVFEVLGIGRLWSSGWLVGLRCRRLLSPAILQSRWYDETWVV